MKFINGYNYQKYLDVLNARKQALTKSFPAKEFGNAFSKFEGAVQSVQDNKYLYDVDATVQIYDLDNDEIINKNFTQMHYYHDFAGYRSNGDPILLKYGDMPTDHDIVFHRYLNSNNSHNYYFAGDHNLYYGCFEMRHENYEYDHIFIFQSNYLEKIVRIEDVFGAIKILRSHGRHCATRGIGNLVGFAKIISETENPEWQGEEAYPVKENYVFILRRHSPKIALSEIERYTNASKFLSTCIPFTKKEDAELYLQIPS